MKDESKTKAILIAELKDARKRIDQLVAVKSSLYEAEESLVELEAQYKTVIEQSPVAFEIYDRNGYLVDTNKAWRDMWTVDPEPFYGKVNVLENSEKPDVLELKKYFVRAFRGEEVILPDTEFDPSIIGLPGRTRWVQSKMYPIRDVDGDLKNVVHLMEDITERKISEQEHRASEERFRLATLASSDLVYEWDVKTDTLDWFGGFYELTGYDKDEIPTNIGDWVKLIHSEDVALMGDAVEKHRTSTEQINYSYRILTKDGNWRHWLDHGLPVLDENNRPVRWVGACIDITDQKRAQEEKLALERQVQHAQKLESLGVLAGGIAHDFNNLLMAILGNADLALHEMSPMSPVRRNLQEIEKASRRAADLAKQMLAYSGKGRFVVQPIVVVDLVDEIAHLLEVSISKKVVLKYNFADDVPAFDGDVTQIRQIIMNLITNASEAIGDRSGVIAFSTGTMNCNRAYLDDSNDTLLAGLDKLLTEGDYTYFEVADTGCGMDEETIDKIFDPFFTTKFTGRGLGMSAVLGIVRGHKGTIKIYSEVGKGTSFKVLFPVNKIAHKDTVIPSSGTIEHSINTDGTILIVDDEDTICDVGRQMVETIGFDVLTAPNGREAMGVFKEHEKKIACVLLDLTMPHMGGEDTFREMRRINSDVKVILCSGYNEHDATQRFLGKGLAGFVQKPFTLAALKEILSEILPS